MTTDKRTPKTLREAIENSLPVNMNLGYAEIIEEHVIEYLAQKFGAEWSRVKDKPPVTLYDMFDEEES